jgi:hypothetical protein
MLHILLALSVVIAVAKLLSAKMIGRWPSGAPLTLAAANDDPELGKNKSPGKRATVIRLRN